MKEKILQMIKEINPYEEIYENTRLIEEGILDSLTLTILVNEIENEYMVTFTDDLLQPEYFSSVADIARLVEQIKGL